VSDGGGDPGLEAFDALPEAEARRRLAACLDVPRWVDTVVSGRPYADRDALHHVAATAAAPGAMDDDELAAALARHPRIGERAEAGHDADHSAREQAGVDRDDADLQQRLAAGNRAYEARFDRVFLVRAAGRDGAEVLAELERRLGNDDAAERDETVVQLGEIARLRLDQLLADLAGQ
jgi:2-oxo-4-hydroxy-4-carboxy-5-ureidoimidazoline decarboxylase